MKMNNKVLYAFILLISVANCRMAIADYDSDYTTLNTEKDAAYDKVVAAMATEAQAKTEKEAAAKEMNTVLQAYLHHQKTLTDYQTANSTFQKLWQAWVDAHDATSKARAEFANADRALHTLEYSNKK